MCAGLLVDGFQLVASGAGSHTQTFRRSFKRFLAQEAIREPCLGGGEIEDTSEIAGDKIGLRFEVDEDY